MKRTSNILIADFSSLSKLVAKYILRKRKWEKIEKVKVQNLRKTELGEYISETALYVL